MKCKICLEDFNNIRIPYSIQPCNHLACIKCLTTKEIQSCPRCNTQIRDKQPNYDLIEELDCLNGTSLEKAINDYHLKLEQLNKERLVGLEQMRLKIRSQAEEAIQKIIKHQDYLINQTNSIELEYNQEYLELNRNLKEMNQQLKATSNIKELEELNVQLEKLKMESETKLSCKYELEKHESYKSVRLKQQKVGFKGECIRTTYNDGISYFTERVLSNDRLVARGKNSINIYDANKGECTYSLTDYSIDLFQFISNERVATAKKGLIQIWDMNSNECIGEIDIEDYRLSALVALSDDRIVTDYYDSKIKIWSLKSEKCLKTLRGHNDDVRCLAVLSNDHIVSGSKDKQIRIWNPNGYCIKVLRGHLDVINFLLVTLNHDRIVSRSMDGIIKIWNSNSGECIRTLESDIKCYLPELRVSNDLIWCFGGENLKIWDANTYEYVTTIDMTNYDIFQIVSNDRMVVTLEHNNNINILDLKTLECIKSIESGHTGEINSLKYLPDGRLFSCDTNGAIKTWI